MTTDTTTLAEAEEIAKCRKEHTVCDATLWSYLQGELDTAEALLVATHYHLSPQARKRVKELNSCAAVSLETLEPVAMKCSAHEFLKKCCPEARKAENKEDQSSVPVPKPLQSYMGKCFDGVVWQTVMPGIEEKRLKLCGSKSSAKIVKIAAGTQIPEHTHASNEITVVIHGAFEDSGEIYKPGEVNFQPAGDARIHAPKALEDSICMIVTAGVSRFPGILGALINPFLRLKGA